jgi:hypothetical protein
MALENKLSFSNNKNFFVSLGVYALGNAIDLASTYYGLVTNQIEEINPLIQASFDKLGSPAGLFLPKLIVAGVVLGSSVCIQKRKNRGITKVNPSYFCYAGGLFNAAIGLSWMFDNYSPS